MNRWLQVRAERVAQFAREFNFPGRCPWLTFRGHPLRIVDVLPAEVLLMRPCGRLIRPYWTSAISLCESRPVG